MDAVVVTRGADDALRLCLESQVHREPRPPALKNKSGLAGGLDRVGDVDLAW